MEKKRFCAVMQRGREGIWVLFLEIDILMTQTTQEVGKTKKNGLGEWCVLRFLCLGLHYTHSIGLKFQDS
ncbi:hypothetical protein Lalb_Chr07g0177831 [Lupinus albus]|uniref:Uncharacterized protein n=1 Tax=Lupinus albus TaxID=3870 RepID=A0A6A4Q6M6_LUPAL|nr:hypothetical protein Lalb_Chr07g0177831 [Lupinus albus]